MPVPDKALIYDTSGTVVGFQSVVPEGNFVSGDCTYNEFYARETIAGQKVYSIKSQMLKKIEFLKKTGSCLL